MVILPGHGTERRQPPLPGEVGSFGANGSGTVPSPGNGNGIAVEVSSRLRTEMECLHRALHESLEGEPPLNVAHVRLVSSWVFNMMWDAAHQDAWELGREIDPGLATRQVLKVLGEMEAQR